MRKSQTELQNDNAVKTYEGTQAKDIDKLCNEYLTKKSVFDNAETEFKAVKSELFNLADEVKGLHTTQNFQFQYIIKDDSLTIDMATFKKLYPEIAQDERIYKTRKGSKYIQDVRPLA